jgi:hypothetical protein
MIKNSSVDQASHEKENAVQSLDSSLDSSDSKFQGLFESQKETKRSMFHYSRYTA